MFQAYTNVVEKKDENEQCGGKNYKGSNIKIDIREKWCGVMFFRNVSSLSLHYHGTMLQDTRSYIFTVVYHY
jgi:hypothetical protein